MPGGIGKPPPRAGGWRNPAPGKRRCESCFEVKALSDFTWNKADGRKKKCRDCIAARDAAKRLETRLA